MVAQATEVVHAAVAAAISTVVIEAVVGVAARPATTTETSATPIRHPEV